jgi:hypothetical protein
LAAQTDFILGLNFEFRPQQGVCLFKYDEMKRSIFVMHYSIWLGMAGDELALSRISAAGIKVDFHYALRGAAARGRLPFLENHIGEIKMVYEITAEILKEAGIHGQIEVIEWFYSRKYPTAPGRGYSWPSMVLLEITDTVALMKFLRYADKKEFVRNAVANYSSTAVRIGSIEAVTYMEKKYSGVSRLGRETLADLGVQLHKDKNYDALRHVLELVRTRHSNLVTQIKSDLIMKLGITLIELNGNLERKEEEKKEG